MFLFLYWLNSGSIHDEQQSWENVVEKQGIKGELKTSVQKSCDAWKDFLKIVRTHTIVGLHCVPKHTTHKNKK